MATSDYLLKLVEKAKQFLPGWLFDKLHLEARGHAGGKGKSRAAAAAMEAEKSALALKSEGGRLRLVTKAEPDVSDVHVPGLGGKKRLRIADEKGRLRLQAETETAAVLKAQEQDVRDLISAALQSYFGEKSYPYVVCLESVPMKGSMVCSMREDGESKYYRASYDCSEGEAMLSDMVEVEQEWSEVEKRARAVSISKPYASIDDLPEAMVDLPKHAKEIMLAAFNAALKQYDDDEQKAWATAWSAVKGKYKQGEGGKWVEKAEEGEEKQFAFQIQKADLNGDVYGFAVVADDEAIRKWQAGGSKDEDRPEVIDTQGDWISEATLKATAEAAFAEGEVTIGLQHDKTLKGASLLQKAVIYRGARWPNANSPALKHGAAFALAVHTDDADTKAKLAKGEWGGFSIGGSGWREAE